MTNVISRYIKPILIVACIITASLIAAFFAPVTVLNQLYAPAAAAPLEGYVAAASDATLSTLYLLYLAGL